MFKDFFNRGKKDIKEVNNKNSSNLDNENDISEKSIEESIIEKFELTEEELDEFFKDDNLKDYDDNNNIFASELNEEQKSKDDYDNKKGYSDEGNEKEDKLNSDNIGFFSRLKSGLSKTRKGITEKIDLILKSYKKIEEELFEELEEVLISADIGVNTSLKIIEELRLKVKDSKVNEVKEVRGLLKEVLIDILTKDENGKLNIDPSPAIILVVGVNGVGKTTTIGKLSSRLKSEGKKVLIAAGDTFRAAAIEQLQEWGNRAGVDIIAHQEGSDPAAVIFDGIQAAKARKTDVLICDTAGRLHNKKNLMNELSKIFKVVGREYPDAKKEVLLVVDATTGQNAVSQAKVFKEACDITGIVLTKLDGTAKGGVVLAVQSELDVPVKLVGVGEKIADLQDFNPLSFVEAIFED
ncbi:MAG: signal recognition particle-docking protein FtsY [Tissierellales bacterium]